MANPSLNIVSDGTPSGTVVFNPDGTTVQGITGITWTISTSGRAIAMLTFDDVAVQVRGEKHR